VEDAALVLKVIAGHDHNDATTPEVPVEISPLHKGGEKPLAGLRIGLPLEFYQEGSSPAVEKSVQIAIEKFKELGAETVEISLPHTKYAIPVYYIITPSEISSNLARFDGIKYGFSADGKDLAEVYLKSRGQGFGREAKRRIMLGTYALSAGYRDAYYLQAQKVRTKIKEELDAALKEVDVILTPTQPTAAFKIGEHTSDPLEMYLEDIYVSSPSLAGLPAMSIPCGFDNGLPVGMQLIGARFDESKLFQVGYQYQQITDWHLRKPGI
jgi:aspartyl-tRNA(Asn)/glutamyl-tRNA(Gln) amidotransferase subunit A